MTLRLWLGSLLALGWSVSQAAPARAYCRTNSCDPSRKEICERVDGCLTGGVPLYWPNSCVTFAVQRDGSTKNMISSDALENTVGTAFDTWRGATCGDGTHPAIEVMSIGQVDCAKVEYNKNAGNANIYMFRDGSWLGTGANALALTTVWYDWHTGKIFDADVEINGTGGDITNSAPQDGADLPSIITHESGHFLGLDHSTNPAATMYAYYMPRRDNLRELNPDDVAGICEIYPTTRVPDSSSCEPRHGFSSSCGADQTSGCSAVPGARTNGSRDASVLGASFALGLAYAARRRRRERAI